ncbi:MAG: cadherin-like domain-containing protein, partial [Rubrivivax sp.]|nr:cadherin-like domain-containing protein [Rubrivivax sp.]
LLSGGGADSLDGGSGADSADSGAGDDTVLGGDGNDTLDGGIGNDRVDGGNGDDWLSVGSMRAPMQDPDRLDHLFGGAGIDIISADFSNQTAAVVIVAGPTQTVAFADGTEARDFEHVHDLFTGSGNDSLRLDGPADDRFANLLKTGAGNDTIYSGAGSDDVDGGDGDDFINGGANDVVLGIELGFGTIVGFTGPSETLAGGAGIDTLSFEGFAKYPVVPGGFQFGVDINLSSNQTAGAATGIVISGFENVVGTDYGDYLTGDDGANVFTPLHGGGYTHSATTSGPDRIDGKGGIDTVFIDFSREDLASSSRITSNSGNAVNPAGYLRQTPDSSFWYADSFILFDVEQSHIIGASKDDQIAAVHLNFNDILSGLGGNDTLGGNGGSDVLLGGDGDDVLTGQGSFAAGYGGVAGGHDVFDGGAGDDLVEDLAYNVNNFTAFYLAADALFQLDGGSGFDTLSADFSNQAAAIVWDSAAPVDVDFADGAYFHNFEALRYFAFGPGDDVITQRGRVDNLFLLGAGNDTVDAGLGVDSVDGGTGDDTAILDFSAGDSAEMAGVQGFGNPDGGSWFRPLAADFFNRPDNIYLRNFERVHVTGTSKNDILAGTYGDDTLIGGDGDDVLDGYWGGNNRLDGGDGDDVLKGSYGINGSGANDTLFGGAGNDTLLPLTGSDTVYGGSGNDSITANDYPGDGYGVDLFDGGDGDDVVSDIYFNGGFTYTNAATRLHLDGGAGTDKISADFGNQTQDIVFVGGASNSVDFADGSYLRNFEQLGSFTSGSGNDSFILFDRGDNLIGAGAGDDTVNPGLGIDFVYGGAGNDLLILDYTLGDGAAVSGVSLVSGQYWQRHDLNTSADLDRLFASGFERYHVSGGSKDDELYGGSDADVLIGNAGNDVLSGGDGNDRLSGGAGSDVFRYASSFNGTDRITDFEPGDVLRIATTTLNAASFVASAAGLGRNQVYISSANGITSVQIGIDAAPGADLTIELDGVFAATAFSASGTDIMVAAVNQAPVGAPSGTLEAAVEDLPYALAAAPLLAGFADPDGDALAVANLRSSTGVVAVGEPGLWTLTTPQDFAGDVTLDYDVVDGHGGSLAVTRPLWVTPVNDAAIVGSADVTVAETNVPIVASGVLGIVDIDSPASFVAQGATAGAYGVFSIATDGAWTYTAYSAYDELAVGESLRDSFAVVSFDGTPSSVSVTITGTTDTTTVRLGDAPLRQSGSGGQWAQAWTEPGYGLWHKAQYTNPAEAWTAVKLHGVSPQRLTGGDIFGGDLGVSGQSAATGTVRQEIDGQEALRITLPAPADSVTIKLASLFAGDDGSAFSESGLLRLFDAAGLLLGERTFVADAPSGALTVTLAAAGGIAAIELMAGATNAGGVFIHGAYSSALGGFGSAVFADPAGKLHGSEFLLDWVDFTVPLVGVVSMAGADTFGLES